jgi:phosphatidylinositol dimannoside acyltransferase
VRRLRLWLVRGASWLACRLPERPLLALADLAGDLWYRLAAERRLRARRNLNRVVRWLDANDMGSPAARAAAKDPRVLNGLVRDAFRHAARYYVQLARSPIVDDAYLARWLVIENHDEVRRILAGPGGKLFVGMHIGWFELLGLIGIAVTGKPAIVPSEMLADPELQAWVTHTRERLGIRLVDLASAKRVLRDSLEQGDVVGLLGDRDITGGGIETRFFGSPAPLAAGPALLAMETGVTPQVFGIWRDADGVYQARMDTVPVPTEGSRRERVTAYLDAEARAFERHIAAAPEQWLAVFHPIWPDLEGAVRPARPPRAERKAIAGKAPGEAA